MLPLWFLIVAVGGGSSQGRARGSTTLGAGQMLQAQASSHPKKRRGKVKRRNNITIERRKALLRKLEQRCSMVESFYLRSKIFGEYVNNMI